MSLFEKIKNKRYELVEAQDQKNRRRNRNQSGPNYSETSSRTGRMKGGGASDPKFDEFLKKEAEKANTTPKKLLKDTDRGVKAVERAPGQNLPRTGFASGEPFQSRDAPSNISPGGKAGKYKDGRYVASGRSTLKGRMRYSGDTEADAAKRLKIRVGKALGGTKDATKFKLDTPDKISKFVDDTYAKQPKLNTKTGKKSSLYKTLKNYSNVSSPTYKSKVTGGRLPLPGGFNEVDFADPKNPNLKIGKDGKAYSTVTKSRRPVRTGTLAQQQKFDKVQARRQKTFDNKILRQAKIDPKKDLPKGGTSTSSPIDPKEYSKQFKADKLKLDYGKGQRFAKRDGLSVAERKKKLKELQRKLNIQNPTVTSKLTGGQLPKGSAAPLDIVRPKKLFKPSTQAFNKIVTKPSGSGGQKSFSIPKTKPTSRFGRMMTALKKNPKTAAAALAIGTGVYLYNKGKNPPKGIVPPVAGGNRKIKSASTSDIKFTLGGSGYGTKAGRTSKGAD